MQELPQADMRRVVWNTNVYEPSDDSFALVDAVLAWLQQQLPENSQHISEQQTPAGAKEPRQQHNQETHQQEQLPNGAASPTLPFLPRMCLEVGCGSGYVICSVALALQHIYRTLSPPAAAAASPAFPAAAAAASSVANSAAGSSSKTVVAAAAAAAAAAGCSFVATDINPVALEATAATLKAHGVHKVQLVQTDLVAGLLPRLAGTVDLLLFNPPYVPTPDEEVLRDGIARAWAGGHMGRRVTDRLLPRIPDLLSLRGHAFIVTVPENKPQEILGLLEQVGLTGKVALTRAADEESLQILHVWRS